MQDIKDKILFKTHQHIIILVWQIIRHNAIITFPAFLFLAYLTDFSVITNIIILLLMLIGITFRNYFFWSKSYLIITNQKISMKVRNWLFSKYHLSIYFKNIKDIAYSKNNMLNYLFNYGSFFARSSAWAEWNFLAPYLPKIEEIYKYINNLYILSDEKRDKVHDINEVLEKSKENKQEIIKQEIENLLKIKWLKEVVVLDDKDKKYIFENEEDRNHGVYESIKREVTLCMIHDSEFRDADSPIVFNIWKKIIFPVVWFHEVKRQNVVSGSPCLEVHNYLKNKFKNLDNDDATVLIGFDM
jgi:hypothetical protein